MTKSSQDARLEAAFIATTYQVFSEDSIFALRIGRLDPGFDAFVATRGGGPWGIVTAANPAAKRCAEADNASALQALLAHVDTLGTLFLHTRHHADDGDWPDEEGVLLLNTEKEEICGLAREFGQCACVVGGIGRPPLLVWINAS
ncbi:DUF3293 domain-containing protein [Propionivibrio dicarboxylicus]|uniref:DUF3293 domain-containing protein n=1 Tax=Propionivibrio dicarboxylicus TaxID=83767 RepID=A0A1G8CU59_9RHOO|nr:DUF3293 domain-containing protein [Propionivibrio dicarboxylicus]SDH49015.1 Protein of unknown function [Propionivibrio dicarboxylicus]